MASKLEALEPGHRYGGYAGDEWGARQSAKESLPKGAKFIVLSRGPAQMPSDPLDLKFLFAWFASDQIEKHTVEYEISGHKILGRYTA